MIDEEGKRYKSTRATLVSRSSASHGMMVNCNIYPKLCASKSCSPMEAPIGRGAASGKVQS